MKVHSIVFVYLIASIGMAQTQEGQVIPSVSTARVEDGAVTVLHLAPGYATSVRLPEEISSVVIGNDDATRADVLNNLGQLAWRRKHYAESEHFLSQALQLELRLSDRRGQASALHYLGLISAAAGEWTKAIDQLEQAVKLRTQLQLRDEAADSLYEIATLQYQHGNSETARKLVEDAISLLELVRRQVPTPGLRAAFYSSKRRLFDLLLEITMTGAGARPAEAGLLLAERGRGRALLDLLAEGSVLRQLPPEFLRRRQELQRRISFLVFHLSSNSKERQEDLQRRLDLLLAEDAEAEAGVRQILNKQRLGVPLTSLEILRHTLPSDTALMEYYLGQHQSYLWLVNAQGIHLYFLPSSRVIEPVVANTAKLFENILDRRRFPEKQAMFEQGLDQLSRILLGKLKGQTLPQRLVIVPDGALYRVPFAALKLPGEKKELGLTHDLIQAPSAGYLMAGRRPRSIHDFPQSVVALADPVFSVKDPRVTPASASSAVSQGQNFARLAFGPELGVISALPEPRRKVLRGFEASRDALSHLPLQNFGLVYFASHAIIEDRLPELSRVVLTQVEQNGRPVDGFLRPYHLAKLRLDGSIVVLSGCETALGKQIVGEGLEGFSSSLFAAGASQLVLALDNIDAEASSEFFARTFASYLSPSGPSMERSMTLARRQMSESQSWSDAYYWASFVVIGRPTEVSRHAASGALSQHSKQMKM